MATEIYFCAHDIETSLKAKEYKTDKRGVPAPSLKLWRLKKV